MTAVRARFPTVPFIYGRLHISTAGVAYVSTVRAGQEALSLPDVHMVDQDPFPLRGSDSLHFSTTSLLDLGHAYSTAVLSAVP